MIVNSLSLISIVLLSAPLPQWNEFFSPDGKFSILLPGNPNQEEPIKANTEEGIVDCYTFILQQEDICYCIAYLDIPSTVFKRKTRKEYLDDSRDGTVANIQGRLLSERIITHSGYSGRELKIELPNEVTTLLVRLFLVGDRFYMMQAITIKMLYYEKLTDIKKCFNSFKILKK